MNVPSNSAVRKAGSTVRLWTAGDVSAEEYAAALETISAYRASFSYPLSKVDNGLCGFLKTLGIDAEVTQRLKRMETIVDKLANRETGLDLTRMVDIGGCRIVLRDDSIDDLRRIQYWIKEVWADSLDHARERDDIGAPRSSGYRAVHLEARRDDRRIEIQIRTKRMHEWAQLIESLSQVFGEDYKQDEGGSVVQEFGRVVSRIHQDMDGMYALTAQDRTDFTHWAERIDDMLAQHRR